MKTSYWFLAVIAILMYNGFLAQRDAKMFDAYDRACAELPAGHPDCVFAKKKMIIAGLMCGIATFYGVGDGFHGNVTASGERFDAYRWTAAHPYLPMGSKIRVTNQDNGKQVIVKVNDRGPYSHADLDLSYAAFAHIESTRKGNATVCYRVIG